MPSDTAPPPTRPEPAPAPGAELHGLVDNAAPDRLYGWAWNAAAPAERVAIELRIGATTVFRTTAEFARPDLAKAGIGDGCHAFEIPLEAEWIRRRAEFTVVARAGDGTETPVPVRIRRTAGEPAEAGMQRAVEAVAAGQRRLHEDLRSIAARLPEAGERTALDALLRAQQSLAEQVDTLTLWLTRLDERLAVLPQAAPPPARRGPDGWTIGLAVVLVAVGVAALALSRGLAG